MTLDEARKKAGAIIVGPEDLLDTIAEAIMVARTEAIIECAVIADDVHRRNLKETYSAATDDGRLIFDSAQATAATIAAAIRSRR